MEEEGLQCELDKRLRRASELYQQAATATALCRLAFCYWGGVGVEENHLEKKRLFVQAAKMGSLVAQAKACQEGWGGQAKDEARAFQLVTESISRGEDVLHAVNFLGVMYSEGRGVERNHRRAAELYAEAAEKGLPLALNNLAFCYENGAGVAVDYARAMELYMRSGLPLGVSSLGEMYEYGRGVPCNVKRSFALYSDAAKEGCLNAQYSLACACPAAV